MISGELCIQILSILIIIIVICGHWQEHKQYSTGVRGQTETNQERGQTSWSKTNGNQSGERSDLLVKDKRKPIRREVRPIGERKAVRKAVRGCLTERQREFVPGRRTKDRERARTNSRKFGSWDSETESIISRELCIQGR